MNILESTITIGSWELPWTLETALFWLLFAIVCITLFMVIVFGILLHRIGKNKSVAVVQPAAAEEPEKVEYGIILHGPEDLPAIQVALYNGSNQIGLAVPLRDSAATILAVPGDYTVKVFGLPENYDFTAGVVSPENHTAEVQVERKPEVAASPYEIRYVPESQPEPEKVEYTVNVEAPDDLPALQIALFNGENQIGSAVTLADGCAKISAVPGDYTVKVFGLPENYDFTAGMASPENHIVDVQVERKPEVAASPYEIRYMPESQPEPEKVEYTVNVEAPDDLPALQIALFNGENQIGSAVTLTDGCAKISAVPGDYTVKIFGLPEGYLVDSEVLSATSLEASVKITEIISEEAEDEIVPALDVTAPEEEVEYNVVVTAPDGLPAMQIALYNGETQIGNAVNVESGAATLTAVPGDYTVKLFGVPDGYDITAGTLSESRHICNITVTPKAVPVETQASGGMQIDEESFEGGTLRYDKSFTARLIQSENEIKGWYTDIKNELLSYKRVHDRMSWKRESYNFGRESFAKISFRGNTLCLYLPIDPNSLMDSKYKIESVEDNASYADTPCLYRIKNSKRAKYAKELIAIVAGFVNAEKFERDSVDYYLPYEGLVELINKGLIKRNIKDKNQEAFFKERREADLLAAEQEELSDSDVEESAVDEAAEYEQPVEEEAVTKTPDEEPSEEPAVEEAAEYEQPVEEEAVTQAPDEEPSEEPAVEEAAEYEQPVEEEAVTKTPDEEPSEESAVDEAAEYEQPAEEEAVTKTPDEEPSEEPAAGEVTVEELSTQELVDIQSYKEEATDEDGVEVVGVMFRRRGRKVYWFDPDGKTWEKGEIALYIKPNNPPQEVIVVDNAKLSPGKLHLPLKPLCKVNRRPQTDKK